MQEFYLAHSAGFHTVEAHKSMERIHRRLLPDGYLLSDVPFGICKKA